MGIAKTFIVLTLLCTAPQPWAPYTRDDFVITNFWKHINELLKEHEAKPARYARNVNTRFPPPRRFPFESFRHLMAQDLLRAAQEGVLQARRMQGLTPAETERQAEANIHRALEYYPLASDKKEDLVRLLYVIEDTHADMVFRNYLMRRCVPGMAVKSLFSDYFQDSLALDLEGIKRILGEICGDFFEKPEIQVLAIDVYYRILYIDYTKVLAEDRNVARWAEETGASVTPAVLLAENAPETTRETAKKLEQHDQEFRDLARLFGEHLDPLRNRTPEVKRAAREHIQRIHDEIPLKDRDAIKKILEEHPKK